jgi:hypothetical protein
VGRRGGTFHRGRAAPSVCGAHEKPRRPGRGTKPLGRHVQGQGREGTAGVTGVTPV